MNNDLLWNSAMVCFILAAIYFTAVFYLRKKWAISSQAVEQKKTELAPIISNFLFHSTDDSEAVQREYVQLKIAIRDQLAHPKVRKVISQILFDLQRDISGGARLRLFELYKQLDLHNDAFQKLESSNWHVVAQGILELAKMQVHESYHIIAQFINDRRANVRKQAELALVYLNEEGINLLLDTTRHSISEWQQLKIIEALRIHENYTPPEFKNWLVSHNRDVVLFSLHLIKHYNQRSAEKSIATLVKHKDDVIKRAAIGCLIHFNFFNSLPQLKAVFWQCSDAIKITLLNAIGQMGTLEELPFLKTVVSGETNFLVLSKAQGAINQIAPETILPHKDVIEQSIESLVSDAEEALVSPMHKEKEPDQKAAPQIIDYIEVEEVEIFDTDEISLFDLDSSKIEPIKDIQALQIDRDQSDEGIEAFMGMVISDQEATLDTHLLIEDYQKLPHEERQGLLEHMDFNADARELKLLEAIVEKEDNTDLRYLAFRVLRGLKQRLNQERIQNTTTLKKNHSYYSSAYEKLFARAGNQRTLKSLYEMIQENGGQKEWAYLTQRKKKTSGKELGWLETSLAALTIKLTLEKQNSISNERILPDKISIDTEGRLSMTQNQKEDHRIALEDFCFLEKIGMDTQEINPDEVGFEFELASEFFESNLLHQVRG